MSHRHEPKLPWTEAAGEEFAPSVASGRGATRSQADAHASSVPGLDLLLVLVCVALCLPWFVGVWQIAAAAARLIGGR